MNSLNFNDTPIEIKQIVFDYLSPNEKAFIAPYVCRKWCGASYANRKKNFDQLFQEVMINYFPDQKEAAIKYQNFYFKILITNDLLHQIWYKVFTFEQRPNDPHLDYKDKNSSPFFIVWNPKTMKVVFDKKEWCWRDIRSEYFLKIRTQTYKDLFEIHLIARQTVNYQEQLNLLFWKPIQSIGQSLTEEERSYSKLCNQVAYFVADVFNFQIVNYVNRLVDANLVKLIDLRVTELPDQLLFNCDDRGIITERKDPSYPWEDYSIKKLEDVSQHFSITFKELDSKKPFIYNWDTEGLSLFKEEGSKKFTIKHILKCCVLSKTVSLLSKRITFLNAIETKKNL